MSIAEGRRPRDPLFVVPDHGRAKKLLDLAEKMAESEVRAWADKLASKVGEEQVASFALYAPSDQADPWLSSFVYVRLPDGQVNIWKTLLVLNRSKFAVPFEQYPTRLVTSPPRNCVLVQEVS